SGYPIASRPVYRPNRRKLFHKLRTPAERGGREATAHDLAVRHQVRGPALLRAVQAPLAGGTDTKSGHHFITDEQGTVVGAHLGEEGIESRIGRHDTHVPGGGLGDEARNAVTVLGEDPFDSRAIVIRDRKSTR